MEDLRTLSNSSSITRISVCLNKIYKKIIESREKNTASHNIKEIELLKLYCKSDNVHLCLMCCQTFVKLVENGALDLTNILQFFITLLPNSNFGQYTTITEGILSLLLLSLKREVAQLKSDEKYKCPYGIKGLQHPLITLIQNNPSNLNDIANKITGIYNHHDTQIKTYSIEFLRPVCLYIFCNPQIIPDSKTIWTNLLAQCKTSTEADNLIREIITWSKINLPSTCLYTSILLIEVIEHYQNLNDIRQSSELLLYLSQIVNHLIEYGIDPRPSLNCVLRVLYANSIDEGRSKIVSSSIDNYYNIILVIFSKTLHTICPIYLPNLLRIFELIIIKNQCGNHYILNLILDGAMQLMARQAFIPAHGVQLAEKIIQKIIEINNENSATITVADAADAPAANENIEETKEKIKTPQSTAAKNTEFISAVRYFHPDIALAFNIAKLAKSFDESEFKNVFTFIDSLDIKTKPKFCNRIQLFLRALFLSKDPSLDCWFKIYQILLSILKTDESIAYDFLMTYIYKLTNETHPEIQLELLRGLPNFAVSKDCIPIILNTLKALSKGMLTTLCMDLYLRLWKLENRTYQFLYKILSQNISSWEAFVTKAYTIREICLEKPAHYCSDLVPILSSILNQCTEENHDLSTSLALDSISILCENNVINISSTWKELSGKFRHEKRDKSLQSLCRFFGTVGLLESSTNDFHQLTDEALDYLWNIIATSNNTDLIRYALKSLANFDIERKMSNKHIPDKFKYDAISDDHNHHYHHFRSSSRASATSNIQSIQQEQIPGSVWLLLLQRVKSDCIESAADLISHYIEDEISSFRGGIYHLPEGKPEPRRLTLFEKSPLKAITDFLISQSRYADEMNQQQAVIITNALRSISRKFSKPIPPLDWSFLHSFFHLNFATRKYCILIAKNQIQNSGTAKRLIENILIGFEPNIFEEDILLIFDILPDLINFISVHVLKGFIDKISTYCYRESQLSGFQEGCLFEKFLDSMKYVCINKYDDPEILDIFSSIAERYMDSMDLDTRLFQKYTEFIATLDRDLIDGLTTPSNWKDIKIDKLKKSTLIRCYLVLYNTNVFNKLNWLNPIIDEFVSQTSEQIFFFRHLSSTLYAFNNDKISCDWILQLTGQIQSLLTESIKQDVKRDKFLFLLDIFVLSIVVLSGCAILLGNLNIAATSRKSRMEIFPESMQILFENIFWKENQSRIYDFLYSMYKNPVLPDDYSEMFKNAIICSRHQEYFDNKDIWTKYVGMRK